jgi:hypothetical protein
LTSKFIFNFNISVFFIVEQLDTQQLPGRHVIPVCHLKDCLDIVGPDVLVLWTEWSQNVRIDQDTFNVVYLQVVGVLPNVNPEERDQAGGGLEGVLVGAGGDLQLLSVGVGGGGIRVERYGENGN